MRSFVGSLALSLAAASTATAETILSSGHVRQLMQ
jgi:hypothetical protein